MPATLVQSKKYGPVTGDPVFTSLTGITPGNTILVKVWQAAAGPVTLFSAINTFSLLASSGGSSIWVGIFACVGVAGSTINIQVITGNGAIKGVELQEWSGIPLPTAGGNTGVVDGTSSGLDTSGTSKAMTTGGVTVTQQQDLLVAMGAITDGASVAPTPGPNYTPRGSWAAATDALSEDQTVSPLAGKTYVGNMTGAANGIWAICAVSIFTVQPTPGRSQNLALVQTVAVGPTTATTISATIGNCTPGNALIVKYWQKDYAAGGTDPQLQSLAFDCGGFLVQSTFTLVASVGGDSVSLIPVLAQIYVCVGCQCGASIQVVTSSSAQKGIEIQEWSGIRQVLGNPTSIDAIATGLNPAPVTGTLATSQVNVTNQMDLLTAIGLSASAAGPLNPGPGFTPRSTWTGIGALSEDEIVSAINVAGAPPYIASMTGARGGGAWAIAAAAFLTVQPAALVGTPPGRPIRANQGNAVAQANAWDSILSQEADRIRGIDFHGLSALPEEVEAIRQQLPWDDTFGAWPAGSAQIQQSHGIPTPSPAAGDVTLFSFLIPIGYDALLTGFYAGFNGVGFQNGSGDIVFRIRVNEQYLLGLSNMTVLMGSPKTPVPLTQGEIVHSGALVSMIVNAPNTSGLIGGGSSVFGGILGFIWPRT